MSYFDNGVTIHLDDECTHRDNHVCPTCAQLSDEEVAALRQYFALLESKREEASRVAEVPVCGLCRRKRTLDDAYDYNPIQALTGKPLGWYSGDDGEICPECMTKLTRGWL